MVGQKLIKWKLKNEAVLQFRNKDIKEEQIVDLKSEIADLKRANDSLEKTVCELRERNMTLKLKNLELENKIKKSFKNND